MYIPYTILFMIIIAIVLLWTLFKSMCRDSSFEKLSYAVLELVLIAVGGSMVASACVTMPSLYSSGYIGSCEVGSTPMKAIYEDEYALGFKSPSIKECLKNLTLSNHSNYYDNIKVISLERLISPATYFQHVSMVALNGFEETDVDDITSLKIVQDVQTSTLTITGEIKQTTEDGELIYTIGDTKLVGNDEKNSIGLLVDKGVKELCLVYDNGKPDISRYLLVSVKELDK